MNERWFAPVASNTERLYFPGHFKMGQKYDDGMNFQTSLDFIANYTDSLTPFIFSK